jgi:hypothetical protein
LAVALSLVLDSNAGAGVVSLEIIWEVCSPSVAVASDLDSCEEPGAIAGVASISGSDVIDPLAGSDDNLLFVDVGNELV